MTYPEPDVARMLNERFVPVQINVKEDRAKQLIEQYRHIWTPDIRILGADGYEYERWNGYLPPYEFLPQLLVSQGQSYLRMRNFADATAAYEEVLRKFPTSRFAPAAAYWLPVCKYEETHEGSELMSGWHRLQTRYPNSTWRLRQSQTEMK